MTVHRPRRVTFVALSCNMAHDWKLSLSRKFMALSYSVRLMNGHRPCSVRFDLSAILSHSWRYRNVCAISLRLDIVLDVSHLWRYRAIFMSHSYDWKLSLSCSSKRHGVIVHVSICSVCLI